jgi:hypothetical protein
MATDRNKTLQELEHDDWGEPKYDSHLVTTCHQLRQKPLKDFTVADIRIMVGQGIGLELLAPMALEELERNPFAEGDYYAGDLLKCLLDGTPRDFWSSRPELSLRMSQVLSSVEKGMNGLPEADRETLTGALREVSSLIKYIKELAQEKASP